MLDLSQLKSYEKDIARHQQALADAKRNLEYAKLQAKQTRQCAKLASDMHIKALIKAYPKDTVDVMPSPGTLWISTHLKGISKGLYGHVPDTHGYEEYRTEESPLQTHHYYKKSGTPVVLIVTEHHI